MNMEKWSITYSSWLISLCILLSFVIACHRSRVVDNRIVRDLVTKHPEVKSIVHGGNANLFIISEFGCMGCNREFLQFVAKTQLELPGTLVYNAATGVALDISVLEGARAGVIVQGDQQSLRSAGLPDGSHFILIREGRVDTILRIAAQHIEDDLRFIDNCAIQSIE